MKHKQKKAKAGRTPSPLAIVQPFHERWLKGESLAALHVEAMAAGFQGKRGKFRRAFIALAGGKANWQQQRDAGAGGTREPFGGKRAAPGPKLDDSQVKRLTPKTGRLKGWTFHLVREPVNIKVKDADGAAHGATVWQPVATVYTSPSGNDYVNAKHSEKADLIIRYRAKYGSPLGDKDVRLRRFTTSSVKRKMDQNEKELERGEAALKRIRKAKREKKLARQKAKASHTRTRGGK